MSYFQAILLSIVEGLTEYLPVSSTGHLILTSWILGINEDPFVKDFTIMVQFGAILAVVFLYWKKFVLNFQMYPKILLGFLPAAAIGLLVKSHIDALLGNVWVVGIALLVGGILLVLTDGWIRKQKSGLVKIEDLSWFSSFQIGLFQCLAFIPGISRSAASIWGGLFRGLDLVTATEFSFFLAVPTLCGASFLKLVKIMPSISSDQIQAILVGNVISFIVGALSIKFFVKLVSNSGLRMFGYYRIALGLIVLAMLALGLEVNYL